MPIILSLAYAATPQVEPRLWAAGPEGLFLYAGASFEAVPQPLTQPACCLAVGGQLLMGGAPYGVAVRKEDGDAWLASWMDGVSERIIALAAHPLVEENGIVLAGSAGGGVLRSQDRGRTWSLCNFGLTSFEMLSLGWCPPASAATWPRWDVVFAGAEDGLFRSPNGGLGWKRCEGIQGAVLAVTAAPDFHASGLVLAGAEETGLWRSTDGGRTFAQVEGAPGSVNALAVNSCGWLLSDMENLWRSRDGDQWEIVADAPPALTLLASEQGYYAGGQTGVAFIPAG